ncbi:MAG: SDR family oxidoreductase [Sulfolobaceae archaeon]
MEKIAIVTGASKGIGYATVLELEKHNYITVAISRTEPTVGKVSYKLDVTEKDKVFDVVNEIIEKFGKIDVLVNNAGFGIYGEFVETSLEEEEYMVKTNFLGVLYFTKAVLPHMIKRKQGNIINIVSEAAYIALPKLSVYSATKAAVAHFTNALWAEVKKYGVKVSGVYPGPVNTNFTSHPSFRKSKNTLWKLSISPEKVAKAVIKAIKTGKREIYVPSKLLVDPYFLKLSYTFQSLIYTILSKF